MWVTNQRHAAYVRGELCACPASGVMCISLTRVTSFRWVASDVRHRSWLVWWQMCAILTRVTADVRHIASCDGRCATNQDGAAHSWRIGYKLLEASVVISYKLIVASVISYKLIGASVVISYKLIGASVVISYKLIGLLLPLVTN